MNAIFMLKYCRQTNRMLFAPKWMRHLLVSRISCTRWVYYVVTVSNSPKCLQMSRQSRLVKSYPSSIHFLCFPRIALKMFHLHRKCCLLVLFIWDQILVNISTSIVFIDQLIFWHIHTHRTLPFPFTSHMTVT